jgi:hypothetical protein
MPKPLKMLWLVLRLIKYVIHRQLHIKGMCGYICTVFIYLFIYLFIYEPPAGAVPRGEEAGGTAVRPRGDAVARFGAGCGAARAVLAGVRADGWGQP